MDRGDIDDSLKRAQAGVREFPRYATGWYVLARAQRAHAMLEDAVTSAERCLSLEPEFFAAWDLLVQVHEQRSHKTAANAARKRLHELSDTPSESSPAPQDSPDALPEAPAPSNLPVIRNVQTPAVTHAPRPRRLTLVRRAASNGSFETPTLAEVYRGQGLLDRALDVYVRILERHPDNSDIQDMINKLEGEMSGRRRSIQKT
jgi:tetratricopeptide (TPR) repeat protein